MTYTYVIYITSSVSPIVYLTLNLKDDFSKKEAKLKDFLRVESQEESKPIEPLAFKVKKTEEKDTHLPTAR